MTNPYFNASLNPLARTLGQSSVIRAEFTGIAAGFDGVTAALALKAPLANPKFTGVVDMDDATSVLVPTLPPTDDSNNAASTAMVRNAIGASGTLIPPGGAVNEVLTADGSGGYDWEATPVELPAMASNANKVLSNNGTTPNWRGMAPPYDGGYLAPTGDVALVALDPTVIDMDSAAPAGSIVTLPDATTLFEGASYFVDFGTGNNTYGVADNDGTLLRSNAITPRVFLLTDNSTAAGTWREWNPAGSEGFDAITLTDEEYVAGALTTLRSGRAVTDYLELSAGVYLVAAGSAASGVDLFVTTVADMGFTNDAVVTVGTDAAVWLRLFPVTGGYLVLYATSFTGAVKAVALTLSGNTVTAGAATTVLATIDCAAEGDGLAIRAEGNGTDVCLVAKTSTTLVRAIMVDITGTTVNIGAEVTVHSTAGVLNEVRVGLCVLSASIFGLALSIDDSVAADALRVRQLSYSGLTITAGTETSSAITMGPVSLQPLSATSMLLFYYKGTATEALVVTALSTTPVFNAAASLAGSSGSEGTLESVTCGSAFVAVTIAATAARAWVVTVSGTAVTVQGSAITMTAAGAAAGVTPYWDGEYVHLPSGVSVSSTLRSVSVAGFGVQALSGAIALGAGSLGGRFNFRIPNQTKTVLFSGTCTARILRFRPATV